ncbi:nucleoside hydrolase [Diaporthe amygdali]|uniref:nucleoside hydrolase n=1 Tax=Phomopsis amygdali TaxID=1214568 RepID=UPI0022FE2806|nr:nucleoside hydrolase [Diaporthe amygdali]KAJ0120571.1 nucleoside hydrolase [Diaporthe amygdali]
MKASPFLAVGLFPLAATASPHTTHNKNNTNSPPEVIFDTDFNTIGDDGQAFAMAAQLHSAGELDLLGISIVTGNQWLNQGVSDALKAVERMGIADTVGVYAGAPAPILHTYPAYQLERAAFGNATRYIGAYTHPGPQPLVAPPDGFATTTAARPQHAADFIIETVRAHPHEVSLLALGPLTNIALAIAQAPDIVPLVRRLVIMGGQAYVPGNAYRGAGETNWWFDAEAARVVLRAGGFAARKIIGLDVTDTVAISNETYDAVAGHTPPTAVTRLFEGIERWPYVYDTVALASLYDESFDTDVRELYVDVDCDFSAEYGKGLVWEEDPYPGLGVLNVSSVVFGIDNARFFDLYVDLLTRPISGSS